MDQYQYNGFNEPAPQSSGDRVTDILANKSAERQQSMDTQNDPQQEFFAALANYQAMNGVSQGQNQSYAPLGNGQQMSKLDQVKQSTDPQLQSAVKKAEFLSNGDTAKQDAILQALIDHPNDVDPTNSFQTMPIMARAANQYDQQALQMPNPLQISMQDLGNIASGKGTNFLGLQQGAAQDIANLNFRQAQENRFNAMAMNGGGSGAGNIAANRIMAEWNAAHPDNPKTFEQAYMEATAKQGQGRTIDPKTGQVITMVGAPAAAGTMEAGKEEGKQSAILANAGPIEHAKGMAQTETAGPKAVAEARGAALGGATVDYAKLQAGMPQLRSTVADLSKLAEAATYTKGGKLYNEAIRQLGMPVPEGATAQAEYNARINNVLLPSMKSMFGARVTNFDISTAKGILGDPDLSPAEKQVQLNAFIDQKLMQVQSDQNLIGNLGGTGDQSPTAPKVTNWKMVGGKLVPQ